MTYNSLDIDPVLTSDDNDIRHDFEIEEVDRLSLEFEKSRVEYIEKSKLVQEQLKDLKNEIEVLKVEENQTTLDRIHQENVDQGVNKYETLNKIKMGTCRARVAYFEEL